MLMLSGGRPLFDKFGMFKVLKFVSGPGSYFEQLV